MQKAFSLVELSIVLVILGLLTGGILGGQSLIKAAELRAVSTEYQRYYTATKSFKDKYFAIPGDMLKATDFWRQSTVCGGAVDTGTCNGNGDNRLLPSAVIGETGESFQFWRQLALAGLIEGTYTGVSGPSTTAHSVLDSNVPKSKFGQTGWNASGVGEQPGSTLIYKLDFGNTLFIGGASTSYTNQAAFKPEEAWNIDVKLDDGKPGTGFMVVNDMVGFGAAGSCTTSASATDYAGNYKLSTNAVACSIFFPRAI